MEGEMSDEEDIEEREGKSEIVGGAASAGVEEIAGMGGR